MTDDPHDLRLRLRGHDLKRVSAQAGLPIQLVRHFIAGGSISPASLLLLAAVVLRPIPHWTQNRTRVRRWLADDRNAAVAAAALGLRPIDMARIAEGRVDLPSGQWRKVAALARGEQC